MSKMTIMHNIFNRHRRTERSMVPCVTSALMLFLTPSRNMNPVPENSYIGQWLYITKSIQSMHFIV